MSITNDNGYPTVYVDGAEQEARFDGENVPPDVSVSFSQVENGYLSDGWECADCGESFETYSDAQSHAIMAGHDANSIVERHPWLNSAAITFNPEDSLDDWVQVSISTGDPRGAFCMTLRKHPDGKLYLSVPHPEDALPHMGLREIHSGYYEVGSN